MNNTINIIILFFLLSCYSCNRKTEVIYYPNGRVKEKYEQKNGKYDGECSYYYEDGTLQAQGKFKNGKMDGDWIYYYSDGKVMTIQKIQDGETIFFNIWDQKGNKVVNNGTGTIVLYYPNGSIKSTNTYKNGHFNGIIRSWYPDGSLEYEQFFNEGNPIGIWRNWDEEGNLIYEENFDN